MGNEQKKPGMFSDRAIFAIIWPIIIERALGAMVSLSDTVMVSNVGGAAVSSIGLIAAIDALLYNVFAAIATGSTVTIARRAGAGDRIGIQKTIVQAVILIVGIMLAISTVGEVFKRSLFDAIYPNVEAAVRKNALTYFTITLACYPFMALYAVLAGSLRGQGNTRTPMRISALINLINIAFNAILIYGYKLGVLGAGLATLLGWAVGTAAIARTVMREQGKYLLSLENARIKKEIIAPVLKIGAPAGLDTLLFQSGKLIVMSFLGGMGTAAISGTVISNSVLSMTNIPGNAFAIAVTTIAGQCFGAGKNREARKNILKCVWYSSALLAGVSAALYFLIPPIVSIYNPTPEAAKVAETILRINMLTMPFFWPPAFSAPYGLRAGGQIAYVTAVSIFSMWTMRVFGAWLLGVYFGLGAVGIFLGMVMDWALRGMFYMPKVLFSKKLKKDGVIAV